MVDQNVGYTCGFGAVEKTIDGGRTWTTQPIPLFGNFASIDFVNATTGWVVGAEGSVYKTTDGGNSWVQQRHDTDNYYGGVSFVDELQGWVCGYNRTILHTTDGGASWVTQSFPEGADASKIRFADAQNGWAVGGLRTILHTTNGGQTWNLVLGGVYPDPANRYPFYGLDATSATNAVAVGAGTSIYATTDGNTWTSLGNGSPTVPYRMARTDANHIWAANSNSEVLYTTDGVAEMGALDYSGRDRLRYLFQHRRHRVPQRQRRLGRHQWPLHNFELDLAHPGRRKDMAVLERD